MIPIVQRLSLILAIMLTQLSLCGANNLPELGQPASNSLSPVEERRLGQTIFNELRNSLELLNDEVVNSYLNEIGYRLVATLNRQDEAPFYFFVVNDSAINAFALPGGFIGVNAGLILTTSTESELAAVMAHEVGHISQGHMARMYQHSNQVTMASIAGLIAAAVLATQSAEAGAGAMAATLAGSTQAMINFTRENEKEADFVGMEALEKAGFDPQGMPGFFQRMGQSTRYYDNGSVPEFLQTHPLTEARLIAAKERAGGYTYRQTPDSQAYHLIKARLQVASFSTTNQAKAFYEKQLSNKTFANQTSTQYGYALSLLGTGDTKGAMDILKNLTDAYPNQTLFQLALADGEYALGLTQQAKLRLEQSLKNHPRNHALTLAYGNLLLEAGEAKHAVTLLNQHALTYPKPETYQLLAKAYSASGQPQFAHMAQAEFLISVGDLKSAIKQLELARKLPTKDPRETAQINARLDELKRWLKDSK